MLLILLDWLIFSVDFRYQIGNQKGKRQDTYRQLKQTTAKNFPIKGIPIKTFEI